MSERMARGGDLDRDVARVGSTSSHVEPARPAPTAAELARDAVVGFDRDTSALRHAVDQVRAAHAANNAEQWTEARSRLDVTLRNATRSHERATARAGDVALDLADTMAAAERQLDELATAAQSLSKPPSGIARVSRESELEAVLAAPIEGGIAVGYQQKEASLGAELAQLSAAECRVLAQRLRSALPHDVLASHFNRMTSDRRGRLLAFLDDARRREAIHGAPRASVLAAPTHDAAGSGPTSGEPAPPPADTKSGTAADRDVPTAASAKLSIFGARRPRGATPGAQHEAAAMEMFREANGDAGAASDDTQRDPASKNAHEIAARGVRGTATSMPHADRIAASFGDQHASTIGAIDAHVGGPAAEATEALGARAYAVGGSVAFGSPPDLHTAAHEAAHVVQQQGGIQLAGGIGTAGDVHEQHADAVADRVVQGDSASDLLAPFRGGSGTQAVQAKPNADAPVSTATTSAGTSPARGIGDLRRAEGGLIAPATGGGFGDLRRAEGMPAEIGCEPQLRALLGRPVVATDARGLQARKHALVLLLGAVPERERDLIAARVRASGDPLAELVNALDRGTRAAVFSAFETGVVPAMMPADSVEWSAFLGAVTAERFTISPDEALIDEVWKPTTTVVVTTQPGYGPPHPGPGAELHVKVTNRAGEIIERGVLVWEPGAAQVFTPSIHKLDEVGRHEIVVDVVVEGLVRKRVSRTLIVRKAASAQVAGTLSREQAREATAGLTDADVTGQATAIRAQLRAKEQPDTDLARDPEYQRLRGVLSELEWQAHARAIDGKPLDTAKPEFEQVAYNERDQDPDKPGLLDADWKNRPALRACLEDLIGKRGFAGARLAVLNDVFSEYGNDAYDAMNAEIDAIEAEQAGEADAFAAGAGTVALGLLDQSQHQVESELKRYGLEVAIPGLGPYGRDTYAARGDDKQMAELQGLADEARRLGEMKRTLYRYVRESEGRPVQGADTSDPGSPEKIEALAFAYVAELQQAITKYPSMMLFLQQGAGRNMYQLDEPERIGDATVVGPKIGYELGDKLRDIATARAKLDDPRAALGLPKIVALTKAQRHVVPGSITEGVVDEAVASHNEPGWTDKLFLVFQIALAVGLIVASVGTATPAVAGAAAASTAATATVAAIEVTMLATDVLLILDQIGELRTLSKYHNTNIDNAQGLLEDLPSGFMVLLSAILAAAGAGSAGKAVARYAVAREAVQAGKVLKAAITEAAGDLANPRVIAASREVSEIAERALGVERATTFLDEMMHAMGAGARWAGRQIRKGMKLVATDLGALARRLGVGRVTTTLAPDVGVRVIYATERGRLAIPEIVAREDVDVQLVLDHAHTVDAVKRYNATADRLRQTMDEAAGKVAMSGGDEAALEVAKHEELLRLRHGRLAEALNAGDAGAVGRIEDEIRAFEGDLRYWEDVAATGRHEARGYIEATDPSATTREALGKGYPTLPEGYFYRRWANRFDPNAAEYQIVKGSTVPKIDPLTGKEASGYRAVRRGDAWELAATDADVVHVYAADLQLTEVVDDLLSRSQSLQRYRDMLDELEALRNLPKGHYRRRMEKIVMEQRRASRAAGGAHVGEVDVDQLRHAIKEDVREDVLGYLDELGAAESYQELRRFTDQLNNTDLGNLAEDWYARRFAPKAEQHAHASKEALGKREPPVDIERDRFVDQLMSDGTAVEIKSISGALSTREIEQLGDYVEMAQTEARIGKNGTQVKRVKYVFTRKAGLRENFDVVRDLLGNVDNRFACEVFLDDGTRISINSVERLDSLRGVL